MKTVCMCSVFSKDHSSSSLPPAVMQPVHNLLDYSHISVPFAAGVDKTVTSWFLWPGGSFTASLHRHICRK